MPSPSKLNKSNNPIVHIKKSIINIYKITFINK